MSKECNELHEMFNSMKRFSFPFDENKIPLNGVYVLFEKNEKAHGKERIVRIGTHTGQNQLRSRLKQHFIMENKDRSIFRKNIGRAILNKTQNPYLKEWDLDLTTREAKDKFSSIIDMTKQKQIEKLVTEHLIKNMSFVVFEVEDPKKRLEIESAIISTVSLCEECIPSKSWLGLSSPVEKIRESGLWLVNELYKTPLNEEGVRLIEEIAKSK
jgi:hypothetical protein